jgi:hypothetical protein
MVPCVASGQLAAVSAEGTESQVGRIAESGIAAAEWWSARSTLGSVAKQSYDVTSS